MYGSYSLTQCPHARKALPFLTTTCSDHPQQHQRHQQLNRLASQADPNPTTSTLSFSINTSCHESAPISTHCFDASRDGRSFFVWKSKTSNTNHAVRACKACICAARVGYHKYLGFCVCGLPCTLHTQCTDPGRPASVVCHALASHGYSQLAGCSLLPLQG